MKNLAAVLLIFGFFMGKSSAEEPKPIHFDSQKIKIGGQVLTVEVAKTPEQHARGLMYRHELSEGHGMIFVFPDVDTRSFWMKNTFIPLDIGYFNEKKELIDIQAMAPSSSEMQKDFPTYVSKEPAKYALEVPMGWFSKHQIHLKEKFQFQ